MFCHSFWSAFVPFKMTSEMVLFDTLNAWKRSVLITFSVKLHQGKQFFWKGFKRVKIFHSSCKSFLKTLEKISEPEGLWVISFNLKNEGQKKCNMTLQHFLHYTLKNMDTYGAVCWNPSRDKSIWFYLCFLTHSLTFIQWLWISVCSYKIICFHIKFYYKCTEKFLDTNLSHIPHSLRGINKGPICTRAYKNS